MYFTFKKNNKQRNLSAFSFLDDVGAGIRSLQTSLEINLCQSRSNGLYRYAKRTCEADAVGEIVHSIFTVYVKSVPLYHVRLAYAVLHMAVKEVFEKHF